MASSKDQVRRVAEFLGISAAESVIDEVDSGTNLAAVRRVTDQLKSSDGSGLKQAGKSLYDPNTHYHVDHASKAAERNWLNELTIEEQQEASAILQPWLSDETNS